MQEDPIPYKRLGFFYLSYFALLGAMVPYWGLYLIDLGFSAVQVGWLGAISMATKIISPYLWGWLSDTTGRPVRIIRFGGFLGFFCFCFIFAASTFTHIALVVASFTFFWNAVLSQFEAVTLQKLKSRHANYSQIRVWGSIGFILTVVLLGYIFETVSLQSLPIFMAFLLLLIWLASLTISECKAVQEHESGQGLLALLASRQAIGVLSVCFLMQIAHGIYYLFFSLQLESLGYSKTTIGLIWSLGVLAEIILFIYMPRLLKRFALRTLFLSSVLIACLRWLAIGYLSDTLIFLIIIQIAHAATFGSFHATSIDYIRRIFTQQHKGQGQAIYSAVSYGAGGALGGIIGGYTWGLDPLYSWLIASLVCALALLIGLKLIRK